MKFWVENKQVVRFVLAFVWAVFAPSALADVLATKQAFDGASGAPITSAELGQTVEYGFNWNCNFTGAPPTGECGDFQIVDPLPAGTEFVSCSVPGIYTCYSPTDPANPNPGSVTIEAADPIALFLNGESATASIIVQLSTDAADFPDGVPGPLNNVATANSADGPEEVTSNIDVNAPTNNWEIAKSIVVPGLPIQPALDSPVIYEIEVCPQGPAGLGTGTIIIQNPTIIDACPVGAVVNSADLNGNPLTFTGTCSAVDFDLPATFDPADGCQLITLDLTYPSATFAIDQEVSNVATLGGDNVDPAECPNNCTDSVSSTLSAPNPDAGISKTAKRNEVSLGAANEYLINFNTNDSNVQQNDVIISDTFPTNIDTTSIRHNGTWNDELVTADIIELGTGTVLAANYNGTTNFNQDFAVGATGFEVRFTTPVPPGFNGGRFTIEFFAPATGSTGDTFENCVTVTTAEITAAGLASPESCREVEIIDPTSDLSADKQMPAALTPGAEFSTRFRFTQDDTASSGAINPTISDCLPLELQFVSWDSTGYSGLDNPESAVNLANSVPIGVAPNFQFIPSGDASNTCVGPNNGQLKWSWKATAPAGSVQLDGSPGVANPFTFPVRRDRIVPRDNVGDASGNLGLFVRIDLNTTLRVSPGVPAENNLENTMEVIPENDNFRCVNQLNQSNNDENDIDGDGNTAESICNNVERYRVLSSAAFSGSKFVSGFPGLPNYDPEFPPTDNSAAASNAIATPANCPLDADGRTRAPCVAQAMEDQPFNYRIRLSNDGNVPITNYIVYDILPHTDNAGSDTGISESQATTVRDSSWVPLLNGPVMFSSANPIVSTELMANAVVEYSASSNPCRPELSINDDTLGGDWQSGACIDDWTEFPLADAATFPNGYASVRAWRLNIPFEGAEGWPIGSVTDADEEDILIDLEMLADPNAPPSNYEAVPPLLNIAWNNVAFRSTNQSTGRRLLTAEAIKTGIVMPPDFPLSSTGLRIGNLVWSDANNNGIAEVDEQGIFDVTVQLWRDTTGDGPSNDDVLFDAIQTDALGKYLFDDADVANRDGLGIPAGDYYVVVPSIQTGAFTLDENYSSTMDEEDANGNLDNDDNGAFDNSLAAVTTSDASSPAIAGIHSGTINLALDQEPTDEDNRSDDLTDDDEDFFDDNDSNVSVDFGFYQLRLGNHVWLDNNNDGVADSTEPAIENLAIQLFLDDGNGVFDPDLDTLVDSDVTDAAGQYLFDGLNIGNYFIAVPSGQSGLTAGASTLSTDTLASSTSTSATGMALTNDNQDDGAPGTFGSITEIEYASVTTLLNLTVGGAIESERDSSSNGLSGSSSTDPADANAELQNNIEANVAFPDTNSFLSADLSFVPAVSLGSSVWIDSNGDGQQDVGEGAIAGATVTLLDSDGDPINDATGNPITTITDADGQYYFNTLPPGTYRIAVDLNTSSVANIDTYFASPNQIDNADNNSNSDSNIDYVEDSVPSDLVHISAAIILIAGDEPESETDPINAAGTGSLTDPDQPQQSGLADNSGNMTLDMGFVPPVSLGSTLWIDDNENGVQDNGETPIEGASVTLLNPDGTVFDSNPYVAGDQELTIDSNSLGEYNFNGLPPGDYRVRANLSMAVNSNAAVLIPTPLQVADPDAAVLGADSNEDSNIDTAVPGSSVGTNAGDTATDRVFTSGVVTLLPNTEPVSESDGIGSVGPDRPNQGLTPADQPDSSGNMTVDMGFIEPVSIGSQIWLDADADGIQDDAEMPIAGALVTLLTATGDVYDSDPNTIAVDALTVTTGPTGEYNFNALPEGDYIVQVDMSGVAGASSIQPSPTQQPNAENQLNSDSNIASTIDPLMTPLVTADDLYRSGVVMLRIGLEATSENDVVDGNLSGGAMVDQPNQSAAQADSNGDMTVDFGFFQPVSLGSTIWEDLNGNGRQDAGELAIENATITLLDASGVPITDVGIVMTNDEGEYHFDGLLPGNYRVRVDLSSVVGGSDLFASPVQIADPDLVGDASENSNDDSNIDLVFDTNAGNSITDQIHTSGVITLQPGTEPINESDNIGGAMLDQPGQDLLVTEPDSAGNMTLDMGFVRPVSLGSTVWQDSDADGTQDDNEPPIVGARITLVDSDGDLVDGDPYTAGVQTVSTTTDSLGQYFFNDLAPGDYRIQVDLSTVSGGETLIASPEQVTDPAGLSDDNTDSNVDILFDTNLSDQMHTSGVITLTAGGEPENEIDPIDLVNDNGAVSDQPGQSADNPDNSGNMTVDLGFFAPLSIGSFVWEDLNGDGFQDSNEPPLAGSEASLLVESAPGMFSPALDINNVAITSQTVGANGYYIFEQLPPGNYRVRMQPPVGYYASLVQNIEDDDDTENDSNIASQPSDGIYESATFTLLAGLEPNEVDPATNRGDSQDGLPGLGADLSGNMTVDFGFVAAASLGNYVWLDLDMDGVQDANEEGIANTSVNLYQDTDGDGVITGAELTTPVATASTGPNGEYLFTDLEPGVPYLVGVDIDTLPQGLEQTFDEGEGLGATDNLSDPIVLDPAEEHLTADFGYSTPAGLGAIGDTVWIDADDDGVQDPGEPGIAGVTVTITPPADIDLGAGDGNPITTMTDGNGKYLFPNLPINETYIVEVDITTLPMGYVASTSGFGDPDVRDGNSSVADNLTFVVLNDTRPVNLDADFGYLPADNQNNSIGDTIWLDVDRDGNGPATAGNGSDTDEPGLSGVTVSLIQDNGDGVFNPADDTVIATSITDSNGMYLFTGLPDGDYIVQVTDQNNVLGGLNQTSDSDDPANLAGYTATTPNQSVVMGLGLGTMPEEADVNLSQDFGYVEPGAGTGAGSIGDTIFFDEDRSGSLTPGEGIEGVTVQLYGPGPDGDITTTDDNILLDSQETDENGNYLFTGLDTSDTGTELGTDYQVVVDTSSLPNGGEGWTNSVDPDTADIGDSVSVTTLTGGDPIDLDQDFGYIGEGANSLSGTVWPDTDGNGLQDEAGSFAGVTIELRDPEGNIISTTTTDSDGGYMFDNLPDGVYIVVVTDVDNVLNGFEHTDSPNGTSDTSDETSKDDTGYSVDLDSASTSDDSIVDVTGDFGYQPSITNPISLGSFSAKALDDGAVQIDWATQTEVANLGFHVYARVDGAWEQLNSELILSQGDSVEVQSYKLQTETIARVFALGDIDLNGVETLHGPFWLGEQHGVVGERKGIDWTQGDAARKTKRELRKAKRQLEHKQREQQRRQRLKLAGDLTQMKNHSWFNTAVATMLSAFIPVAHAAQSDGAAGENIVNMATTQAGIHHVTHAELLASSGVDLSGASVSDIAVINMGLPSQIQVIGSSDNPAIFGAGGSIRFIAESVDTLYTDTNVYTLRLDQDDARRMALTSQDIPSGAAANAYLATVKYAPQSSYSFVSPNKKDPWYAKRIVAVGKAESDSVSLKLDNVAIGGNSGTTKAKLSVNVWGATNLPGAEDDHHVKVSVNGVPVTASRFDGLSEKNMSTPLEDVREGANRVTLELPLDTDQTFDAVSVDDITISYPRAFVAQDNRLQFLSTFKKFRITGFDQSALENKEQDLVVMRKVGDDFSVINNADVSCRTSCRIIFGSDARLAEYFIATKSALHKPEIRPLPLEQDISTGQANYLIISHPDFVDAASLVTMAAELESEFGSIDIVDVEAIYAQYGHNIFDPTAIQRYIKSAVTNRGTEFVLLVGGDVYDYRKFENEESESFIPSIYAATGNNITFAPVDAKYVDLDNDNVPDLPIGRLPVRTESQLNALLKKRTAYNARTYQGKVLLVADEYDALQQYDFGDDADEIETDYLSDWNTSKVYVDDVVESGGSIRQAREEAVSLINQGQSLTAFFGHSSTNQWAFNGLFTGSDAANLSNIGKPTVVTQWGCWNAYYVSPNEDSMGHRFMMEGEQGAVAVMGASTLTNADSERRLARKVFERLSNGERLGQAITNAKQDHALDFPNDLDVLLGWTLLGMPDLIVN